MSGRAQAIKLAPLLLAEKRLDKRERRKLASSFAASSDAAFIKAFKVIKFDKALHLLISLKSRLKDKVNLRSFLER